MRTVEYTEHGKAGAITRRGVVWSPGPVAYTVWVLPAEVIEAGHAPCTSEAVVVDVRTMTKDPGTVQRVCDGWNLIHATGAEAQEKRLTAYGYGWRESKIPGTSIPYGLTSTRNRKLPEKAWRAVVGDLAEWAPDADVVELYPQDPDQIAMVA